MAVSDEVGIVEFNGKKYVPVVERVKFFRDKHPTWSIVTEVKKYAEHTGGTVLVQASIVNETGGVVATGHSATVIGTGRGPAGDAPLEFTETKAIGRALACFGLPGGEYASAEEMWHVISNAQTGDPDGGRQDGGFLATAEVRENGASPRPPEGGLESHEHSEAEPGEAKRVALREAAKAIVKFVGKQDSESLRQYWDSNKGLIDDIKEADALAYGKIVEAFKTRKEELEKTDEY